MRRRHAPGGAAFHFSLFILNCSLQRSATGYATAKRTQAAPRHAPPEDWSAGATDRGGTAGMTDEQESARVGSAADAVVGLLFGSLLKIRFRPQKVAGRQQPSTDENKGKLTRHAGHSNPLRTDRWRADRFRPALVSVFVQSVPHLYHATRDLASDFPARQHALNPSTRFNLADPSRRTSSPDTLLTLRGPVRGRGRIPSSRRTGTAASPALDRSRQ